MRVLTSRVIYAVSTIRMSVAIAAIHSSRRVVECKDCVDIEPDRHAQGKGAGPAVGVEARHAIERALADNEPFSRARQRLRIARNPGADTRPYHSGCHPRTGHE